MGEGEVAFLALALALPLAVHIDLGHLHHVAHLHNTTTTNWVTMTAVAGAMSFGCGILVHDTSLKNNHNQT